MVVPGMADHVTQRGNRRREIFFIEDDYRAYLELMADQLGTSRKLKTDN